MDKVLLFMIIVAGMSHIIVDGSIFNNLKLWLAKGDKKKADGEDDNGKGWRSKLLKVMNCYQCSGFWCGFVTGLFMWLFGCDPTGLSSWLSFPVVFLYGCAGAFSSMIGAVLIVFLQSK